MSALATYASLLRASAGGSWRGAPGRLVLAVLGIAFGVALGVAVHLINTSAAGEFSIAVRSLAGEADLVVRGPRSGFPEALYPRIARLPEVQAVSPALELDVALAASKDALKIVGLDPFRAALIQPQLIAENRTALLDLLEPDTVLLSRSAADTLGLKAGDRLRLNAAAGVSELRILALLPAGATPQQLAIMDIAEAQKQFSRIGALHRLDLKLRAGVDRNGFVSTLSTLLPAGTVVATPEDEAQRSGGMARAYRTNLDMLALVALFTGAFLVFSTQFLSLIRRRTQLALLRVLGVTHGGLLRLLIMEGAVVGVLGSALGVALGCVLARIGLATFGGDLGAGYFRSITPALQIDALALVVFFVLGVMFATLGAALPALEASRRAPALALKAGDEEEALRGLRRVWPSVLLIVLGLMLSQLPPVYELPIAGYAAVAAILLGAILFMPRLAEAALSHAPYMRHPPAALAVAQLQSTPRQVGVSLAAILASFSLMVAMLIMVGSFRASLETWLDQMLPADLYVRAGRTGDAATFTPEQQSRIATLPGISNAVFIRSQNVFMRSDRPPLSLHARAVPMGQREPALPYIGRTLPVEANAPPPAWISEVAADLLRVTTGSVIDLPLAGALHRYTVAGIWRDYARQNGAITIDRERYSQITGDASANEAALHLAGGADITQLSSRLRSALADAGIEIASTRELKAASLTIFERTFAVTYALEVAAVLIGLFGVSASFSAQALARRRELGVLRHIGMTRAQVATMLGCEGCIVGALGVIAGLATGWIISLILIHVINRQSFHWSMDLTVPWIELALLAAALVAAAAATAVSSGRRAMSDEVTRAVREDW